MELGPSNTFIGLAFADKGRAGSEPNYFRVKNVRSVKRIARSSRFGDFRKDDRFPSICGEKHKVESEEDLNSFDSKKLKTKLKHERVILLSEAEGGSSGSVTSVLEVSSEEEDDVLSAGRVLLTRRSQ